MAFFDDTGTKKLSSTANDSDVNTYKFANETDMLAVKKYQLQGSDVLVERSEFIRMTKKNRKNPTPPEPNPYSTGFSPVMPEPSAPAAFENVPEATAPAPVFNNSV